MKRTWRAVFSILLAVALMLPMVPAAHAEGEGENTTPSSEANNTVVTETPVAATSVHLESDVPNGKIYYRNVGGTVTAGEITVTAAVSPSDYSGNIQWKLESGAPLSIVSQDEAVSNGKATIVLKATQPSTAEDAVTLTAVVDGSPSQIFDAISIRIARDTVNTSAIAFTGTEASVQIGKTVQLRLNTSPAYPSGVGTPAVTYASSKPAVAKVDANGKVTGVKEGSAIITAKVDDNVINSAVLVSVLPLSTTLTGSVTLGTNYSMRDIYDSLLSQFSSAYGSVPTKVFFPNLSKGNGTLKIKSGEDVVGGDEYDFSRLRDMYLAPSNAGTFKCNVTVKDGVGNTISGTVTITISVPNYTIRIPIDGTANYTFAAASADVSGKSGAKLIRDSIGAFSSIEFGAVSSASSSVGSLYTNNPPSNRNRVSEGTVISASAVDELYFTPSRSGTYTVNFTAYASPNGTGSVVCTGTLVLPVDGTSLDLSITLNSVSPYTFSDSPSSGTSSLYFLFLDAINSSFGGTSWGGIRFDGAVNASSIGTLHQAITYSRAISSSDYISKTNISKLYYVPERSGTYEITYGVYASETSANAMATGKLTISTSTIPVGMSDISYTTAVKGTVTLKESDFVDYFQLENGSKYNLSYVVFNEYDGDGTFSYGTSTFLPYNSPDFYTSTYTGSTVSNARYLDRLSFTAPSTAGYTAVRFTCYGGTGTNSTNRVTTGKLCIYYTVDNVPTISYNVYNVKSVDLQESDFVSAYSTAMKSSASKPSFKIQLLNVPNKGTLYYYSGTGSSRRTITATNIANYTFTVNDRSGDSVENLTYTPGSTASGSEEITYLATSTSGSLLYVGTLQFKLSSDLTLNVTNDGSNFQLSDFYNASDKDPVTYVTFPTPSSGRIYVYANNRYLVADPGTKFYTVSAANGQYPLTSVSYAPKANETGTVTLRCIAHRKSGVTNDNSITVNVLSKASSGSFSDVGGVTGWASNSIDFAARMGLVNGTQKNPPLFSPSSTMRRCDFVLMLYRLAGSPKQAAAGAFSDVSADKYYYDSATWAYRNSIMRNVTVNNKYNPDGALTRQDFAQILFNYTNAMSEKSTSNNGSIRGYADASKVDANTLEGVTWAVANGYITSAVVGQLYIEPQRAATRAEISTLLHRYLTY